MTPRRVLLRLAFDGTLFGGTQRNPGRLTVDGAILAALTKAGALPSEEGDFRPVGRTDAGVSARDYPVAVDSMLPLRETALALAGGAPGIVPFAGALVPAGYDPRHAAHARTYRYHAPRSGDVDVSAVERAWQSFVGTHDFSHFARISEGKHPTRTVLAARMLVEPEFLVFEVKGESFLWNQVRRMVGAALEVGTGKLAHDQLVAALKGEPLPWHAKADAEGLVLHAVDLPLPCEALPEARALGIRELERARDVARTRLRVMSELTSVGP